MKTYKFNTKVSSEGVIKIPHAQSLAGKHVEVIIVPQPHSDKNDLTAGEFIQKWAGFLSTEASNDYKYQYLSKKYK